MMSLLDRCYGSSDSSRIPDFNWKLRFSFLPRRCSLSGNRIWLELAYRGTRDISTIVGGFTEVKWRTKLEHVIQLLKE